MRVRSKWPDCIGCFYPFVESVHGQIAAISSQDCVGCKLNSSYKVKPHPVDRAPLCARSSVASARRVSDSSHSGRSIVWRLAQGATVLHVPAVPRVGLIEVAANHFAARPRPQM